MKRIISILLVLVLLSNAPMVVPRAQAQAAPIVFMIAVALIGGALVFYVYHADGYSVRMRTLALQVSHYDGNWSSVATNRVLVGACLTKAFPSFTSKMTEGAGASYRLVEVQVPPDWTPQFVEGGKYQPVIAIP